MEFVDRNILHAGGGDGGHGHRSLDKACHGLLLGKNGELLFLVAFGRILNAGAGLLDLLSDLADRVSQGDLDARVVVRRLAAEIRQLSARTAQVAVEIAARSTPPPPASPGSSTGR